MRLKGSVSPSRKDGHCSGCIPHSQVDLAIAIEIARRKGPRTVTREVVNMWPKRAISVAEQNRSGVAESKAPVGDREIQLAISVEVADCHR